MRRGWEFLALLLIGALLLQAVVEFVRPLIPYVVAVIGLGVVTASVITVYRNHRSW